MRHSRFLLLLLCFADIGHASSPVLATGTAKFVDAYRVHLQGTVTPQMYDTTVWFEYGTSIVYGSKTPAMAESAMADLDVAVENLKEQTPYHFRIAARTSKGTVYGSDATFTTSVAVPVGIDVQPAEPYLLEKVGTAGISLAITGHGSSAKYQWLHNNAVIPLAVYETYHLPVLTTALAGTYACRVSNPRSTLISDPVVVAAATISPATQTIVNEGGSFAFTAAITPVSTAATYVWSMNSSPTLGSIGTVTGATAAKLTVTHATASAQDAYHCDMMSQGKTVTVGPVSVAVRLKPLVTQVFPQMYQVGEKVNLPIAFSTLPTSVTVTGLPPGLVYNASLHAVTGRPLVSSMNDWMPVVIARNLAGAGAAMTFFIQVDPLDTAVKTTFNALIERQTIPHGNNSLGGAVTNIVVAATGTFTGKVVLAATPYSFSGQLDTGNGKDPAAVVVIKRVKPLANLSLNLTIDHATGHLTGTLNEDGDLVENSAVDGWGNPYSTKLPATGLAGLHNFWMDPPAGLAAGTAPEGAGIGSATISTLGVVTLSIKLADGSLVTSTTTLGKNGDVPVHAALYAAHGSVHGGLVIADQLSPALNSVHGSLTWNKTAAASAADHAYVPAGFDLGVASFAQSLAATGSEYTVVKDRILWGLTDVAASPGQVNAQLTFSGGGVETAALATDANETFRLSKAYGVVLAAPNKTAMTLSVVAKTGAFSGTFYLKDGTPVVTRKVIFQGITATDLQRGRGFFTLAKLPVTASSAVLSGAVDFAAK